MDDTDDSPDPRPRHAPERRRTSTRTPCIVTFITSSGRRCFYATHIPNGAAVSADTPDMDLPSPVRSQLDALRARVAWRFLGTASPTAIRGPGARNVQMVTEARPDEFGRVVFR